MSNDYDCLCNQYGNLLTCYANCPGDVGVTTVQQQRDQNCIAASGYPSTSSTLASAAATTSQATLTNTATTTSKTAIQTGFATGSGTDSSSPSASASTSADSGNGAVGVQVAGGLVAVAFAGFGLVF